MSKSLPKNMFLQGIWEPINDECDIHDPIIIGEIPKELNGTFYRNGPNPQYVYSDKYHMFEGDGMIHAVTFENGKSNIKIDGYAQKSFWRNGKHKKVYLAACVILWHKMNQ